MSYELCTEPDVEGVSLMLPVLLELGSVTAEGESAQLEGFETPLDGIVEPSSLGGGEIMGG